MEEPDVEEDSPTTQELSAAQNKSQDKPAQKPDVNGQADNADYVNPWDLKKLKLLDNTLNWQEMWNPRHSMSITHTKGLLNAPGENNCFLNSAVQVRLSAIVWPYFVTYSDVTVGSCVTASVGY